MANGDLNYLLREKKIEKPGDILYALDKLVKGNIKENEDGFDDLFGMDMALCSLDTYNNLLEYAGAFNAVWIYDGFKLDVIKADRYPVGHYFFEPDDKLFKTHSVKVKAGDKIYLFSDGYQDQFGGKNGDKFLKSRLETLIVSTAHLSLVNQRKKLSDAFDDWKSYYEQIDDVMIFCVEV